MEKMFVFPYNLAFLVKLGCTSYVTIIIPSNYQSNEVFITQKRMRKEDDIRKMLNQKIQEIVTWIVFVICEAKM